MTDAPEPTLNDVIAVMNAGFAQVMTELAKTNAKIDGVQDSLGARIDVAETSLRAEIRATEARLAGRIDSVSHALRTVKEDLAQHVNDPNAHHGHAA
jgi:hypothetical protein